MSKIEYVTENSEWAPYATITVSKREAALLGMIASKTNGRQKIINELYRELGLILPSFDVNPVHVELNDFPGLEDRLNEIGAK